MAKSFAAGKEEAGAATASLKSDVHRLSLDVQARDREISELTRRLEEAEAELEQAQDALQAPDTPQRVPTSAGATVVTQAASAPAPPPLTRGVGGNPPGRIPPSMGWEEGWEKEEEELRRQVRVYPSKRAFLASC